MTEPKRFIPRGPPAGVVDKSVETRSARWPVSRVLCPPKPGGGGHSSGTRVTARLARPTRAAGRECPRSLTAPATPIRSCSRWGLPCRPCHQGRGALLPHHFTLTLDPTVSHGGPGGMFLWHFPWGRPRRPLAGTVFPWSPDFPPPRSPAAAAARPPDASGESMGVGGRASAPPAGRGFAPSPTVLGPMAHTVASPLGRVGPRSRSRGRS